jgi:hypothetical protein
MTVATTDDLPLYGTEDVVVEHGPVDPIADPLAGVPRPPVLVLPSTPASFFRVVGAPPVDVCTWLAERGEVEERLRVEALHDDGAGAWSVLASMRRPVTRRWVTVEIVLCPHVGGSSRLTLNPAGRVRASGRWFRSGHRALDELSRRAGRAPLRS